MTEQEIRNLYAPVMGYGIAYFGTEWGAYMTWQIQQQRSQL